jgi:hypothetical protein
VVTYGGGVRWLRPEPPVVVGLLAACAAPLVVLVVWFGVVDQTGIGEEGRCSSCGVEGYVIAAHVAAAGCLALVVAALSAVRRVAAGSAGPGAATVYALVLVGVFIAVSLAWHKAFAVPATVALLASLVLYPVAVVWWAAAVLGWLRRPPTGPDEVRRSLTSALWLGWTSLLVLLPGTFAWVWLDRVEWLVF